MCGRKAVLSDCLENGFAGSGGVLASVSGLSESLGLKGVVGPVGLGCQC